MGEAMKRRRCSPHALPPAALKPGGSSPCPLRRGNNPGAPLQPRYPSPGHPPTYPGSPSCAACGAARCRPTRSPPEPPGCPWLRRAAPRSPPPYIARPPGCGAAPAAAAPSGRRQGEGRPGCGVPRGGLRPAAGGTKGAGGGVWGRTGGVWGRSAGFWGRSGPRRAAAGVGGLEGAALLSPAGVAAEGREAAALRACRPGAWEGFLVSEGSQNPVNPQPEVGCDLGQSAVVGAAPRLGSSEGRAGGQRLARSLLGPC